MNYGVTLGYFSIKYLKNFLLVKYSFLIKLNITPSQFIVEKVQDKATIFDLFPINVFEVHYNETD